MNNAPTAPNPSRRRLFTGFALGGAAAAGGIVGATATAAGASSFRDEQLVFEVACNGDLWREGVRANPADDGDFRAPFSVEGWIYPEGTIKGDGFVPTPDGSIGVWFCRGYVVIDSTRAEPHTCSHQDYMFGEITEQQPFPTTMMSSTGLEGTLIRDIINTRAIVGGTGDYLGATGQVTQQYISDNTTVLNGIGDPAPCFRFVFDLRLPD